MLIATFTLLALEGASWLVFDWMTDVEYDSAAIHQKRSARLKTIEDKLSPDQSQALYQFHPYTGYTGNPGSRPWKKTPKAFNQYGMLSAVEFPYKKKGNEYVVAVLGGSVAEAFVHFAEQPLEAISKRLGITRQIVLVNLTAGGYKQPQQLFLLQYALLAGFEVDAVLNIDGYNDLVMAEYNRQTGTNPLYPSGHHMGLMSKLGGIPSPQTIMATANYFMRFQTEANFLHKLNSPMLSHSIFTALVGEVWMKTSARHIDQAEYLLAEAAQKDLGLPFRGPDFVNESPQTIVEAWRTASELLYATAKSRNLTYIHVLQPNQYVTNSKPLSPRELEIAFHPNNPWSKIAVEHYDKLITTGAAMRASGLPFFDMTSIFNNTSESIYVDDCCHFHALGNKIMAEHILPVIVAESSRQDRPLTEIESDR